MNTGDNLILDKIKKQVEFYFSDANFTKDKFLIETHIKNEGVPINILLSFKRLVELNATIENIKEAISNSKIVEFDSELNLLKKIETEEYKAYRAAKDLNDRILFIGGFNKNLKLEKIENILLKYCQPVKITMRRNLKKNFTGNCFVELASKEEAEKLLTIEIIVDNICEVNTTEKDESAEKNETVEKDEDGKRIKISDNDNNDENNKISNKLVIKSKKDYLSENPIKDNKKTSKQEQLEKKIKEDFVPKLYKIEFEGFEENPTIDQIKKSLNNIAFVDLKRNVIRMKYREEWDNKEIDLEGKIIKINKLTEEEAKEYVSNINIKSDLQKKKYKNNK